ncbi:MAG: outer membrane beta-barrel protein [Candidatus Omnitrophica bacterium]|nr:outer membrane beta-barrel protein [Candidatus Omnitrophota bacterium]
MYQAKYIIAILVIFTSSLILGERLSFAKNLDINATGQVITAFDDNITSVEKGRRSDFITNLETGLVLLQKGETHELSVKGDLIEQIFAKNSNFDNLSEDLNLSFKQELSKYDRVAITDILTNSSEPRTFQDAFGRSNGRYNIFNNQTGLSYTHDFSKRLSGEVHASDTVNNYSKSAGVNSVLYQAGTKVNYTFDSATILNTSYDYIRRIFEHNGSATVNSLLSGVRRYFTSQFYLDLAAGPDFIKTFTGRNVIKPHYKAAVTDQVDQNNNVSLSFEKQDTTTSYDQDLFNSWRTALNLSRQFSQRLNGNMNIFYGQGRYEHLGINESFVGVATQVSYDLTRKTKLSAGYNYTNSLSKNIGNAYRKNYFYISIGILF